ncbi:hypothetical protein [Nonomuraea sp. GTA35]|uniref:hypothetical protein n=1 Tax=Nonomuraea sp. GTA35 TaxID=1676746 RepID=UPI0035BF1230
MQIGRPVMRAMRAAAFAALCVLVSAVLHGLAGGTPVRQEVLLGAYALTWAGAFLIGGRQRGLGVLLVACFVTQYGMHHLFSASAAVPAAPFHDHGSGVGMFLVHGMTALISAWWLKRGESALAALLHLAVTAVRLWGRVLTVLLGGPVEAGVRPRPDRDERVTLPRSRCAAVISRRGPPALLSLLWFLPLGPGHHGRRPGLRRARP